jgi:uncharacterized membrane protein YoaK (UPF0700 family)
MTTRKEPSLRLPIMMAASVRDRSLLKKTPGLGQRAHWLLPLVLSTTAGAVDVVGFLGLGGLFTAHITGNLVVLAAHYITGRFGEIAPLLSVPTFVAVLGAVTLTFARKPIEIVRRALLILQAVLLACFLGFGTGFGPFPNPDSMMAVFVGMLGVAAMATQNGLVRLALPGAPTTAVMTTNLTQLTIDLATLARRHGERNHVAQVRYHAGMTSLSVIGFAVGLALGAVLEIYFGLWSLILPVMLAALAIPLGESWTAPSDKASHSAHA